MNSDSPDRSMHKAQQHMHGKVVFVLIDGLGDVSLQQLSGRTPLQVARTPFMDAVAASGLNGLMDPVEPGLSCGSDTAHMSIFGYEPRDLYRGRGAFESMGAGIPMSPGDIAFKSNFATLDTDTNIVVKRRADRRFEHEGPILCEYLNGLALPSFPECSVAVQYATEHRCGVVVRGPDLSDEISGTDPLKDNLPLLTCQPTAPTAAAKRTAAVVNELSQEIQRQLREHPLNTEREAAGKNVANVVLLRGCGSRIAVQPFAERHGLRACMVAPTRIIAGMGMTLGIDRLNAPGASGCYRTALHAKAEAICASLEEGDYDFGFLHIKAVDDTGHDRLWASKVQFLESVDKMLGQMVRRLWQREQPAQQLPAAADSSGPSGHGYCICLTADHSTPVVFGDHSHEPVPFAIAHVSHVVQVLGTDAVCHVDMGAVAVPDVSAPAPSAQQMQAQAAQQIRRRQAAAAGQPWLGVVPGSPHSDPWPCAALGDNVMFFDEVSAARGALGRFPGKEAMGVIKQFIGMECCGA